jgi:TP901-1 family phage major tail protein
MFLGRELLIERLVAVAPETWEVMAGGRSVSASLNGETVDITTQQSAPWRTLLADAGIRSMALSISGVFNDDDSMERAIVAQMEATLDMYRVTSEAGDSFMAKFQVVSVERSGEYNADEQYSISMESSGEVIFTPAS